MFNCHVHTFVSGAHARLAANWMASLQALGIDELGVVHCADQRAVELLSKFVAVTDSACTVELAPAGTEVEGDWGSDAFARLMTRKLDLLQGLATYQSAWLYTDADCSFLADPFEALSLLGVSELDPRTGHARAKLWFQDDLGADDHRKASPDNNGLCSGVIYCGGPGNVAVFQVAKAVLVKGIEDPETYIDDQGAVNAAQRFLCAPFGVLPCDQWVNGARKWVITREALSPILVHANWIVGVAGKELRLRSDGAWFVRDDHLAESGLQ